MKTFLIFSLVCAVFFTACDDDTRDSADGRNGHSSKKSERNLAINAQNAYSDLFLDSNKVEKFIADQKLNDTLANDFRRFYNQRNFQFAWFASDGVTEQTLSFRSLYDHDKESTVSRKSLDNKLDDILTRDSLTKISPDTRITKTELLLTWRFINYITRKYSKEVERNKAMVQMVPAQKAPALVMAEEVLSGKRNDLEEEPEDYKALKKVLGIYLDKAKAGGFPVIDGLKKTMKKGDSTVVIRKVKSRLAAEGMYPATDTTYKFNEELEKAVKQSQQLYGLKDDGKINIAWVKELNVPVGKRIEQILINMERMKWMPVEPQGKMILVNIPEFRLHVLDRNEKVFDMDIVVGKEGSSTINFCGTLNQVVFNPYWNVPRSIVFKEVLPGMESNPNYLEEHQMEITGEEDGLPVVRQLPGEQNALGKVKFIFPNSFNIYFHDTPEKSLFKKTKRAYSHGCIRLSEPMKMAAYLVGEDSEWISERVDSLLQTQTEKWVKVKESVTVMIAYNTCWVNQEGKIAFREDIYSYDKKMTRKLFEQSVRENKLAKK
ncbi:L,D-transpeptidase family protein [Flavitalea sp.]|nr:L,D-transpeptidase family protein [Flavitalea sp.]